MSVDIAGTLKELCDEFGFAYVFKGSFDKANRSSIHAGRGPGLDVGREQLGSVRALGIPVTTDVHEPWQAAELAEVTDILQIPAFLCRQTDLILACAATGKIVNIKKGQFMSPWQADLVMEKAKEAGAVEAWITERGTTFGYDQLVVDMRGLALMKSNGHRVFLDASHSTDWTYPEKNQSSFIAPVARAGVAVGIDGLFFETHPDPALAVSDGPRSLPLAEVRPLLDSLARILDAVTDKAVVSA